MKGSFVYPSIKSIKLKHILIAGGSGLIGQYLVESLRSKGHKVQILSRSAGSNIDSLRWDPSTRYIQDDALEGVDAIINLAGASVAGHRWTKAYKEEILKSRIESTQTIVKQAEKMDADIHLINASAIGYYPNGKEWMKEDSEPGDAFLSQVCKAWEYEALQYAGATSIVRIGLVMAPDGGFLTETARPIKWGLGAVLGSGEQMQPWIHYRDLIGIFEHILDNRAEGIFNAASPLPESNRTITKAIAKYLHRPILLPAVPAFALKIIFGEFSQELLADHRISAEKIQASGFTFQHEQLEHALQDLIG